MGSTCVEDRGFTTQHHSFVVRVVQLSLKRLKDVSSVIVMAWGGGGH